MRTLAVVWACLAVLGAAAAEEWQKPDWCKERDCPRFKVENSGEGYETRTYEAAHWAYVKFENVRKHDEAIMEGFAHLFHYFNGENEGGEKMPMTAPVATNLTMRHHSRHHHATGSGAAGGTDDVAELLGWAGMSSTVERRGRKKRERVDATVKFYLPYDYQPPEGGGDPQKQPPKPNSDKVQVKMFPEWTAHVASFDGFPSQQRFMDAYEDLVDSLEDDEQDYSNDWAVFSIYNAPEELEERHNEVLLPAWEEESAC